MHRMKIINRWIKCDRTKSSSVGYNSVGSGIVHSGFIPGSAPASSTRRGVSGHHMCDSAIGTIAIDEIRESNSKLSIRYNQSLFDSYFPFYANSQSYLPYIPLFQKIYKFTKS